ncbi:MAG: ABC transporter permease [Candidatus Woesearchaeota archaeon]
MTSIKSVNRDVKSFFINLWAYILSFLKYVVKSIQKFDYNNAYNIFLGNLKIFSQSKSIFFIALFLPIILTFIVGISLNASYKVDDSVAINIPSEGNVYVTDFIKEFGNTNFKLIKYNSQELCLDSVKTGKSSVCLLFSDSFGQAVGTDSTNQMNILFVNVDESRLDIYGNYLSAINSSLAFVLGAHEFKDSVSIKRIELKNSGFAVFISNIILFFVVFLSLMFAAVTFFYRKPDIDEFYLNPRKYTKLLYETFFSGFVLFLVSSLIIFFVLSFLLGFSFFAVFFRIVFILAGAVALFTLIGMFIGLFTSTEDLNLFVSISIVSIMVFLSELIFPTSSLVSYFSNINLYALTTKMFKHLVLLSKDLGDYFFEIMILVIFVMIFVIIFTIFNYLFVTNDKSLKNFINDRKEDRKWVDVSRYGGSRSPRLSTEELSLNQYRRLEELKAKGRAHESQIKPTYKDVVNVKIDKHISKHIDNNTKDSGAEYVKAKVYKRREEEHEEPRGDEYLQELYEEQLEEVDCKNGKNDSSKKGNNQNRKTSSAEDVKAKAQKAITKRGENEADDLILSIELENEILELKHKGLKEDEIVERLKDKYDEEDISMVLANM